MIMLLVPFRIIAMLPNTRHKISIHTEIIIFQSVPEFIALLLNNHIRREGVDRAHLKSIKIKHANLNPHNTTAAQAKEVDVKSGANNRANCPETQEMPESVRNSVYMHPNWNKLKTIRISSE